MNLPESPTTFHHASLSYGDAFHQSDATDASPPPVIPHDASSHHVIVIPDDDDSVAPLASTADEGSSTPSPHIVVDIPHDASLSPSSSTTTGVGVHDESFITPSSDHIVVVIGDDDSITPISSSAVGVQDSLHISDDHSLADSTDSSSLPRGLHAALSFIRSAGSIGGSLPRGSDETNTPARLADYGKWIDHCTLIITILTSFISILSIPYPLESPGQRYTRASSLIALCALLLVVNALKIALEHIQDQAGWFYYHTKRGPNKIFYTKVIGHILGLVIMTCSFSVAAVSYIASKFNEGQVAGYILSLGSLALSLAYNVSQHMQKPKKKDLVERTTNGIIYKEVRACRDIPPEYGTELLEINPEKMLVFELD